jgi:hypothetical protein
MEMAQEAILRSRNFDPRPPFARKIQLLCRSEWQHSRSGWKFNYMLEGVA